MVLNYIWVGFFLIAFVTALVKLVFLGDAAVFPALVESLFNNAETGATLALGYIGLMTFWLGLMKVGERGGAIQALTRAVSPFFQRLFPGIPKGHPASGAIMMNFSANMLGLDNAATPLGLKAMSYLQELNDDKNTATNAMIMFLVLNTSGLTLIPISVITLRSVNGAANPTDVFIPIMIATFFATLAGLIVTALVQRIRLFHPIVMGYLGAATALICALIVYFQNPVFHSTADLPVKATSIHDAALLQKNLTNPQSDAQRSIIALLPETFQSDLNQGPTEKLGDRLATLLNPLIATETNLGVTSRARREALDAAFPESLTSLRTELINKHSTLLGTVILFSLITTFIGLAARKRINIYEAFIDGAKEGFTVSINIIPYLVAMLAAIGVFRASGAMDVLIGGIRSLVAIVGGNTDFVEGLPTAFMKPLSGSGARGMAVEAMQAHGPDSFIGRLACVFQGSTETLFYTLAVYYGSVKVRNTRYTVTCGLAADLAGIIAAIFVAYLFFH